MTTLIVRNDTCH